MQAARGDRKALGARGEAIARVYLEGLGWRILATNFRCASGELDLVGEEADRDGVVLAFVEVKTRRGALHGLPVEAVDARKQTRLLAAAQAYLGERSAAGEEPRCRFDIVEVVVGPDDLAKVTLRRGAFGAS